MKGHFVVQGAPDKRMGVSNMGGETGPVAGMGSPEDGLETADRAGEKEIAGMVMRGQVEEPGQGV